MPYPGCRVFYLKFERNSKQPYSFLVFMELPMEIQNKMYCRNRKKTKTLQGLTFPFRGNTRQRCVV